MVGTGCLRLESQSCSVEFHSIRHRITKRGYQYTTALDHQTWKRSVHRMESRMAAADPESARNQYRPAERFYRCQAALDVQEVTWAVWPLSLPVEALDIVQ